MHPRHRSEDANKLFKSPEWKLIGGQTVKFSDICVHQFNMGDVEDPDLYAAQPISEWQDSDAGQWVMKHAVEVPFWHRTLSPHSYGWTYHIIARLSESDELFWTLKYK